MGCPPLCFAMGALWAMGYGGTRAIGYMAISYMAIGYMDISYMVTRMAIGY
jgi:hypothetical protein